MFLGPPFKINCPGTVVPSDAQWGGTPKREGSRVNTPTLPPPPRTKLCSMWWRKLPVAGPSTSNEWWVSLRRVVRCQGGWVWMSTGRVLNSTQTVMCEWPGCKWCGGVSTPHQDAGSVAVGVLPGTWRSTTLEVAGAVCWIGRWHDYTHPTLS